MYGWRKLFLRWFCRQCPPSMMWNGPGGPHVLSYWVRYKHLCYLFSQMFYFWNPEFVFPSTSCQVLFKAAVSERSVSWTPCEHSSFCSFSPAAEDRLRVAVRMPGKAAWFVVLGGSAYPRGICRAVLFSVWYAAGIASLNLESPVFNGWKIKFPGTVCSVIFGMWLVGVIWFESSGWKDAWLYDVLVQYTRKGAVFSFSFSWL